MHIIEESYLQTFSHSLDLYIPIPHLKLDDLEQTNLFLRLDTIRVLPNNFDFQIVGNLPHYVKDKIVRFNSFMKTL